MVDAGHLLAANTLVSKQWSSLTGFRYGSFISHDERVPDEGEEKQKNTPVVRCSNIICRTGVGPPAGQSAACYLKCLYGNVQGHVKRSGEQQRQNSLL